MSRTLFVRAYRLAGAALIAAAAIYVVVDAGDSFSLSNFFSYFTIESNLFAAVILLAGVWMVGRRPSELWEMLRGAAVLYMGMTGLVYQLLLSGIDVDTPGFANWTLHAVMPIVVVADWLFEPPQVPLAFRRTLLWLALPLAYLPYTLIRGEIVDWYPYPFVDPTRDGGYWRVAGMSLVLTVAFVAAVWVITWVGNHFRERDVRSWDRTAARPAGGLP